VRPIEYVTSSTVDNERLEEVVKIAQSEVERRIRHIVQKFGGFRLIVEDGPMRAEDSVAGVLIESGDAVRITIRPKFDKKRT
jgi:hypothetical protein